MKTLATLILAGSMLSFAAAGFTQTNDDEDDTPPLN